MSEAAYKIVATTTALRPRVQTPIVRLVKAAEPEEKPEPRAVMRVPTLAEVQPVVFNIPESQKDIRFTSGPRRILDECADKHSVMRAHILSTSRIRALVRARHEAMYRMRAELALSYPRIAQHMGVSDHTTCYYGASKHAALNGLPIDRMPKRLRELLGA